MAQAIAKTVWWRSRRIRGLIIQVVLVAAVGILVAGLVEHVVAERGASGFGFLNNTAGFDIIQHLIPYTEQSTYGRVLLVGLLNTLLVAVLGIFFATILGFLIGIGQLSSNWLIARLCVAYVEVLRNLPLLLQIFFGISPSYARCPPRATVSTRSIMCSSTIAAFICRGRKLHPSLSGSSPP